MHRRVTILTALLATLSLVISACGNSAPGNPTGPNLPGTGARM